MKDVLLVDDDQICNLISSKTLEKIGFTNEIHTALNGKEAINLFNNYYNRAKTLPDLILLDLNMPIMDGFGFLEAFNRLNLPNKNNVKIIIVTSSQNPDDVRRVNELGVNHILSKPITEEKLNQILNSVYGIID